MHARNFLATALALSLAPAFAQSTSYAGKWTGTMEGNGGRQVPVEVTLAESSGTWRMMLQGAPGRNNPCIGKALPLTYEAVGDQVRLDIQGAQLIAGCIDQPAALTHANGQLTGTLRDGRAVTLTKQ